MYILQSTMTLKLATDNNSTALRKCVRLYVGTKLATGDKNDIAVAQQLHANVLFP